jgi:hypothetical protein
MIEVNAKAYDSFNKYKEGLKKVNRFFIDPIFEKYFDRIIKDHEITIIKDETFYRARINNSDDNYAYSDKDINMPPYSVVQKDGRCNPNGIAYFYLANNVETTIPEVRPEICQRVSVGEFKLELEKRVLELNFSASISGNISDELDSMEIASFMGYLLLGFTQPVLGERKDLEYLPYQYFAEYCKRKGLDGIKYKSSTNRKSPNNFCFTMFNNNHFKFVKSSLYFIENIQYNAKKLSEGFSI